MLAGDAARRSGRQPGDHGVDEVGAEGELIPGCRGEGRQLSLFGLQRRPAPIPRRRAVLGRLARGLGGGAGVLLVLLQPRPDFIRFRAGLAGFLLHLLACGGHGVNFAGDILLQKLQPLERVGFGDLHPSRESVGFALGFPCAGAPLLCGWILAAWGGVALCSWNIAAFLFGAGDCGGGAVLLA